MAGRIRRRFLSGAAAGIAIQSLLAIVALVCATAWAVEEIPQHRAKQIEAAAPAKARVEAKRPRRAPIRVTPEHLMPKDPHQGYDIPYAVQAMKALGTKTGAFEPVVSQDLTTLGPEQLKQWDAIVLCNASGPWITPTDESLGQLTGLSRVGNRDAARSLDIGRLTCQY
jgi:hypothetical protein